MAERYRQGRTQLTAAVAGLVRMAAPAEDEDIELAADTLLALVDGLASDLLLGHLTTERALAILDRRLSNGRDP
ncbi:hypothetical protein Aph01nite_11920 [Acrocarpospora phusangensis]|uniref:BetI-type transcriptional repressor C-terminal domain-containing protein n=1 Tax=Acrocarpospora phusangensis TaxID=1070424 RepID=A0A919Q5W6_9ACTN|nr:hypothetical protein Aph01nite_11920 [Acrocarpospora phusangensis]